MPNLTKSLIDQLPIKAKDYVVWDSKVSGFGIKITPKGRKSYLMKYRTKEGRQRKPHIGVHGNITCEQARDIARQWHADLAKGLDPLEAELQVRNSPTISDLCDRFFKEYVQVHKKPSGHWIYKLYIEKYIKPKLGTLKTASLTRKDVALFHNSLKETPVQANRIIGVLSTMFTCAEEWGLRQSNTNPARGIKKFKEEKKERYLSDNEIQILIKALNKAEAEGTEIPSFIALVRLLLLTGARLSEVRDAKWEWIDKEKGTLNLPDSKTGRKTIHLSPAAITVLDSIAPIKGNPFIITGGVEGKPLNDAKKPWRRLKSQVAAETLYESGDFKSLIDKLKKELNRFPTYEEIKKVADKEKIEIPRTIIDVRLHDLRHTYASICVNQGMTLQMVAKLLGHAQTRTSERYAHLAHSPVQEAAAKVGEVITGTLKKRVSQ